MSLSAIAADIVVKDGRVTAVTHNHRGLLMNLLAVQKLGETNLCLKLKKGHFFPASDSAKSAVSFFIYI